MDIFSSFLKKILFLAICISSGYCFNAYATSEVLKEKYLQEEQGNKDNKLKIKNDLEDLDENVEEVVEHKNKKYRKKKYRKRADWNDWHGLRNKKNVKTWQRCSKTEILENELKHYEITRQNLLNAYQRKNYDKRQRRRLDKYVTKTKFQKTEKINKDNDFDKANEKYLKYKDNIRKMNQKYENGEYVNVVVTNANVAVNDKKDNNDGNKEEDIRNAEEGG